MDLEVDAVDRDETAETLRERAGFDQRVDHGSRRYLCGFDLRPSIARGDHDTVRASGSAPRPPRG